MVLENFLIDADILWDRAGKELYEKPEARTGRIMRVQVTNRGVVEDLTGYTLNLGWKSTVDETKFGLDAFEAVGITKGIFELEYTSGMLTNIGTLKATLQLVPVAGNTVESDNFVITVTKSAIDAEAIQSETSFTALALALVDVNAWNATISGKVIDWEADMEATKQTYITTMNDVEATYPQELISLGSQLADVAEQLSATNQPIVDIGNYFSADNTNAALQELGAHKASSENPHGVTKAQVGLGNVDNTSDANKPVSTAVQTALNLKANKTDVAEQLSATNQPIVDTGNYFATDNTNAALQELGAHKASSENPHGVTKAQVGLGSVDNTSDANKPVSTATQTALNLKANKVQEAWITPTLTNGWVAFGGAEDGPTYYKDDFGNVKLRGVVKSGTLSVSMFKLPIGYRPAKNKYFAVISNNVPGFVLIDPYGRVIPHAGTSNVFVALDSISFKVD